MGLWIWSPSRSLHSLSSCSSSSSSSLRGLPVLPSLVLETWGCPWCSRCLLKRFQAFGCSEGAVFPPSHAEAQLGCGYVLCAVLEEAGIVVAESAAPQREKK